MTLPCIQHLFPVRNNVFGCKADTVTHILLVFRKHVFLDYIISTERAVPGSCWQPHATFLVVNSGAVRTYLSREATGAFSAADWLPRPAGFKLFSLPITSFFIYSALPQTLRLLKANKDSGDGVLYHPIIVFLFVSLSL